jgi:hypothetical protein
VASAWSFIKSAKRRVRRKDLSLVRSLLFTVFWSVTLVHCIFVILTS